MQRFNTELRSFFLPALRKPQKYVSLWCASPVPCFAGHPRFCSHHCPFVVAKRFLCHTISKTCFNLGLLTLFWMFQACVRRFSCLHHNLSAGEELRCGTALW